MKNKIKELRREKGMTQEQLGEALGITHSAVAKYESGNRKLSPDVLSRTSEIFDCSVDYLIGRSSLRRPVTEEDYALFTAYHAAGEETRRMVDALLEMKNNDLETLLINYMEATEGDLKRVLSVMLLRMMADSGKDKGRS